MARTHRRFCSPFEPLALSSVDVTHLEQLAHLFVQDHIAEYEQFLRASDRRVDDKRWKFIKQQDNISSYVERRNHRRDTSSFSSDDDDVVPSNATKGGDNNLPVLLVTGTVAGTVDDVMYGAANLTLDSMRLKTAYVDDHIVDCTVLSTLSSPTANDPFLTLVIKWFEVGQALHIRSVVKNRDFVVLEATGLTTLSTGERVGYQLQHSVHFPQTRELDFAMRGNLSICAVSRQVGPNAAEIFTAGCLNPAGGLLRAAVVKSAANAMASAYRYVHCAQMNKLAWAVRRRHRKPLDDITEDEMDASSSKGNVCVTCSKQTSRGIISLSSSTRCKLCLQPLCGSCKLKKPLCYIARSGRMEKQELSFCASCIHEYMIQADARAIASDEYMLKAKAHTAASYSNTTLLDSYVTISDTSFDDF